MPRGSAKRKKVYRKDIKQVKALVEHCLGADVNKEEVVQGLQNQLEIQPGFTKLVWQKLEEENDNYFKAYYATLDRKQKMLQHNKSLENQRHLMCLNAIASLPTFDGSHNPAVFSQPNSTFDGSHNPALLSQPNSTFNGSHNPALLSQPNSTFDWSHNPGVLSQPNSTLNGSYNPAFLSQPNSTFDGSYNPAFLSQPNSTFNGSHNPALISQPNSPFDGSHNPEVLTQPSSTLNGSYNPAFLSQPNSTFDGTYNPAFLSQPNSTFNGSYNPAFLSQPNSYFDGSYNPGVLSQPDSNVGLSLMASLPTFDGSQNHAVLSQPNSNVAHIPAMPNYPAFNYTAEQIQAGLMPANMQHHPVYPNSFDLFDNAWWLLQSSMHGAYDVSAHGNGNWINGPSNIPSTQSTNMDFIQGFNEGMIEPRPAYSGFVPLNGGNTLPL